MNDADTTDTLSDDEHYELGDERLDVPYSGCDADTTDTLSDDEYYTLGEGNLHVLRYLDGGDVIAIDDLMEVHLITSEQVRLLGRMVSKGMGYSDWITEVALCVLEGAERKAALDAGMEMALIERGMRR